MNEPWYEAEFRRKPYLHNLELTYTPLQFPQGEHDHCELCWARFSDAPEDLQEYFQTSDGKVRICRECVNNYADLFGWKFKKEASK